MRGGRSLLLLLVLALGLGAYIYFVEAKRDLTDPTTKRDKVFSVDSSKIAEIEVRSASGETTTVKKTGADWQVVSPIAAPADQTAVESVASAIATAETDKTLDDAPASAAAFGLEPARMSVAFKIEGDAAQRRLNIGGKTPTGADLYARVEGQPKLILVPASIEDSLNRTTFDLRDKTMLRFARDGVDAISLQPLGAPAVTLARKGGDWRVTAPTDVRADFTAIDTLIGRAAQAQAKSIVAGDTGAPPKDLKTYGLDKPQFVATFGAGSTRASLAIGAKKDDANVYARDVSKPLIFTVESSLLTDLNKKVDDLRSKDIFVFKGSSASGLDISRGDAIYTFTKTKTGTDAAATDVWKETKPQAKDINLTGMTDFLNSLSSLQANKFADHPLTSGDELVVVARSGDAGAQTEEHVIFRRSGDVVQAIKSGEPGAAIVTTADFDKALTQFKELMGIK